MKQTITYQGKPISVELLEPCCAPTPTPEEMLADPDCKEFIEKLEWLENYLLENPELSWQTIGYRVSEVFQRDYNRWDIILSNGKRQIKCWIKTGLRRTEISMHWAVLQSSW